MKLRARVFIFLSLHVLTATLSLPPPTSLLQNSTAFYSPYANFTASNNLRCDSRWYGEDLSVVSCENAWKKISQSTASQVYRTRSNSAFAPVKPPEIAMPVRYLSDDGVCAIDIKGNPTSRKIWDVASDRRISETAKLVLNECVIERKLGGSFASIGMSPLAHDWVSASRSPRSVSLALNRCTKHDLVTSFVFWY